MDPLREIVTRHVFRASTEGVDLKEVLEDIVTDYMRLLHTQGVHIPHSLHGLFFCDIKEEIQEIILRQTQTSVADEESREQSIALQATRKIS